MYTTQSAGGARSPRRRLRRPLLGLAVALTAFGTAAAGALPGPAGGAETPVAAAEREGAVEDSADTPAPPAVAADGTTRVIVGLDVAETPEHELDARGAFAQRIEIDLKREELSEELEGTGATIVGELTTIPYAIVEATPEALAALQASPVVTSTEPVRHLTASLDNTTALVGADAAQATGFDGTGTTIAVLDTGVDRSHAYLAGRVVREACFSHSACPNGGSTQYGTGSARPCVYGDGCWHGTHVTGIAAGDDPNADNYTGVAPGADIFAVQVFSPVGGYVLDRWGTLHAVGVADPMSGWNSGGFPGWDIARSFALRDSGGGYVLDAWGGLHRAGNAPSISGGPYWQGWDIARGLALLPGGAGGYVMDGWGGLHRVGNAPALGGAPYWTGWDIARDVALHPDGGGYTLDGWGGIHEWGGAPKLTGGPYWPGWDIARGLEITADGTGAWVVDAFGGRHRVGTAPKLGSGAYWPPWSIARDVAAVPDATAYTDDLLRALDYVNLSNANGDFAAKPLAALNMSLGGGAYGGTCDFFWSDYVSVLNSLRNAGIASVAASGNQGYGNKMNFPACMSKVVSVGATFDDNTIYQGTSYDADDFVPFTNRSSVLDLFAPGHDVRSAIPGPLTGSAGGTSMASPHVAGAFAVLREKVPLPTGVGALLDSLKLRGHPVPGSSVRRIQLDASLGDFP